MTESTKARNRERLIAMRERRDEPRCENCQYYVKHYFLGKYGYIPTMVGHCIYPRVKERSANDLCDRYEKAVL